MTLPKAKNIFNTILLLSLVFLAYALAKADYLVIPHIYEPFYLGLSIIILCLGMISNSFTWWKMLRLNKYQVSSVDAIKSTGLSIFAKYIPGKIFMILGKAEYMSAQYGMSRRQSSMISLQTQLITLLIGFSIGLFGLFFSKASIPLGILLSLTFIWLLLVGIIFTTYFNTFLEKFSKVLFKSDFNLPVIRKRHVLNSSPFFILNWLLWGISFYLLCYALTDSDVLPLSLVTAFPLAVTIGIMSLIAPGGLGIREGMLTYYLVQNGMEISVATTLSIACRLWFLLGEAFIFLLAILIPKIKA